MKTESEIREYRDDLLKAAILDAAANRSDKFEQFTVKAISAALLWVLGEDANYDRAAEELHREVSNR